VSSEQDNFKIEAYGTVSPPPDEQPDPVDTKSPEEGEEDEEALLEKLKLLKEKTEKREAMKRKED